MSTELNSLVPITLDYRAGGPALHCGYSQARSELDTNRGGFIRLDTVFKTGTVPVILRREDLYVIGFQSADGWWRFGDAAWPLVPAATSLGFDGQYATLGGLSGSLRREALDSTGKLCDPTNRSQWKRHLRTLLIVVAENLRLVPVNMLVLGLLNGIRGDIELNYLEPYIRNWGKASAGKDMMVQQGPNLKTGFRDPTIIRR